MSPRVPSSTLITVTPTCSGSELRRPQDTSAGEEGNEEQGTTRKLTLPGPVPLQHIYRRTYDQDADTEKDPSERTLSQVSSGMLLTATLSHLGQPATPSSSSGKGF